MLIGQEVGKTDERNAISNLVIIEKALKDRFKKMKQIAVSDTKSVAGEYTRKLESVKSLFDKEENTYIAETDKLRSGEKAAIAESKSITKLYDKRLNDVCKQ